MQEKKYNVRYINRKHLKLARTILDLEQREVAKKLGFSIPTITNFERNEKHIQKARISTLKTLIDFYEESGVRFLFEGVDGGCGVYLADSDTVRSIKDLNINIAITDIIVTDSFIKGSSMINLMSKYSAIKEIRYNSWSDRILDDLLNNRIDIAIYNKNRANKFINERAIDNIEVIDDVCYSMGGDNFFLIGKKEFWKFLNIEELQQHLEDNEITIVTTKNSDNLDNLSLLIDISHKNLKIINLPSNQVSKELFALNSNILVYGNQNIRYSLLFYPEFIEVVNHESIKDNKIRENIKYNSNNSFLVNKNIYNKIPRDILFAIINEAKGSFFSIFNNQEKKNELRDKMQEITSKMEISKENSDFIIENILYKTYRLSL